MVLIPRYSAALVDINRRINPAKRLNDTIKSGHISVDEKAAPKRSQKEAALKQADRSDT